MSLKHKIRDFGLRTYLKNKTFVSGKSSADTRGVGVLFTSESLAQQQLILNFIERLKSLSDETTYLFGYVHKTLDSQVTFAFPHFSLSDIGLIPDFSKHKLDIFMQRDYRILVNLDLSNFTILHYIVHKTTATNKLSLDPDFPTLYNIIVKRDGAENLDELLDKTLDIFGKTIGV